jgi:Zn-dependent peptidase ImmA (M78 family)/transcriptional regulator with XRE-family HTH domain
MSIPINPSILVWARQSAGLTIDDAAEKLAFSTTTKSTAAEKLAALETGQTQPTRSQLNSFANVYKRPLLTFYLSEPPRKGDRGQDFRQTPEARGSRDNGMLDALLRDVKARQEMVRDILLDDDNFTRPDFVGSARMQDGVPDLVQRMANRLGFAYTDISLRSGNSDELFTRLRKAVESIGVFVLVLGDLGSHHTTIAASVFRGFAIADVVAPFVVINGKDAQPARAFTLIHELAHIWLGQSGVSGDISTSAPTSDSARIERFCNDVAGEFLLPEKHFRNSSVRFNPTDVEGARACIDLVAGRWSVSEPMVAYRFQRSGELSAGAYETLRSEYYRRWIAKLARDRERNADKDGGPSAYTIKKFNLGNALIDVVHRGFKEKSLTHTKAATILGSKAISVSSFLSFVEDKHRAQRAKVGGQS